MTGTDCNTAGLINKAVKFLYSYTTPGPLATCVSQVQCYLILLKNLLTVWSRRSFPHSSSPLANRHDDLFLKERTKKSKQLYFL